MHNAPHTLFVPVVRLDKASKRCQRSKGACSGACLPAQRHKPQDPTTLILHQIDSLLSISPHCSRSRAWPQPIILAVEELGLPWKDPDRSSRSIPIRSSAEDENTPRPRSHTTVKPNSPHCKQYKLISIWQESRTGYTVVRRARGQGGVIFNFKREKKFPPLITSSQKGIGIILLPLQGLVLRLLRFRRWPSSPLKYSYTSVRRDPSDNKSPSVG